MDQSSVLRCPLLCCLLAVASCSTVHHHFRSSTPFQHLIVDRSTSTLYAAATNALYQLDGQDLSLIETAVVGPVQDHPLCTEEFGRTQCSAGGTLKFDTQTTDNVNKVFVVDAIRRQIVSCGSVFQGVCETRSLSNISVVTSGSYVRANTDYFIAANSPSPSASTVAFTGFGPSRRTVLYVASTYTGTTSTSVRQAVPAVSSRSLDPGPDLFRFTHVDGLTGGTLLRLRSEAIEKYPVEYVSGFRAGGFAYLLTNQRDGFQLENSGTPPTIASKFGSRIAQVCENDRSFYSYVEMPLRCAGLDYNLVRATTVLRVGGDDQLAARLKSDAGGEDVLVTVFVRSRDNSDARTSTSAVCLYRLSDVRRKFVENVRKCFSGEQQHVGSQFTNRMCVSLGLHINESYCGEAEQNGPLVGSIAIDTTPIITYSNSQLTAVAALTVNRLTVLYLGTNDGHLKKVALQADGTWQEFNDSIVEEGSPVNQDMLIDSNSSSLFVMTTNKIVKMPVTECEQHTNCESCRSAGDPHCGWCALERKCSTKTSCMDSTSDDRWLSQTAWECIRVPAQFVSPARIGVRSNLQISVGIKALPLLKPSEKYLCMFGANSTAVVGRVSPNEVKCQLPPVNVPQTAVDDHVNVTLFIKSSRTQVNFVDTNLTIFDCAKHISCTTCSQSMWGCSWCIGLNKCLQPDSIHACSAPVITDRQMCPQLKYLAGSSILIPFDISTEIPLSAAFLPSVTSSVSGYECLVHLTSPPVRVPAHRINDTVLICDKFQYTFEAPEPLKTVSLEVVWNNSFVVDDNYGITVTVYHCESMASDCSTCLSLREAQQIVRYNCQWCGDSCQFNGTCTNSSQLPTNTVCPLPHIEHVYPLAGPLEGGTQVTIQGTNLGRSFDQVQWSVTVATLPCEVIESEYIISHQIVCTTGRYVGGSLTGDIVVTIGGSPVTWINKFTYQNPEVLDFSPMIGPMAGGTKVTFEGQKLNTGAMIRVMFDDVPCLVEHVTPNGTILVCTTMPVPIAELLPVAVHFDRIRHILDTEFEFTDNPTIKKISPLTSFVGGGRTITVSGTNFHSIQQPLMHLSDWTHNYTAQCQVKEDTVLHCPTPTIDSKHRTKRSDDRLEFIISFTMDGVESVRNLPQYFPTVNYTLTTFSDPVYTAFENGLKIYKGEALILTGQNLNTACRLDEVTVSIGNATCKVNSVDATTLYCSPPTVQPTGLHDDPHQLPLVTVRVGKLVYELGRLKYQKLELLHADDQWIIIVVAGACGGTLLTLIVIIVAVYKRKSTRAERQFTKLQVQLDALESNIRHECKQAFAELQTEVIDFTSDLNVIGIPFWDYRSYTFKVLFPSFVDHPILLQNNTKTTNPNGFEDSLNTFYQLLNIDQFLLIFIQTLEEQKTFGIRDKSMVASLLMVIFQDKMEYATEILKVLLNDLIERSLERKTPKLLLRRTESVVEKLLTNWLSLCMYPYLKTYANKPLFMLYKAIKHQTEKGPIDAVTAEARYSLSEDRLLREKTESHSMTVFLLSPHNDGREPVACKMLNCDTVTQAKEKALDAIYMNTPFSRRPSVHDLDLVLVGSKRGTHVLRDEDHSSAVIKSWRRLNTLAHYQVVDGATLALQPRQIHNGTGKNGTMKHHHNGKLDSSNGTLPVNVSTPILAIEDGSKLFHLTRHDDGVHNAIRGQKVISEIFLTRLLATKCTLQQYVDDLFATILRVDTALPSAVKYLFDFLDCAAMRHSISDPDVVHTWKSNSLLLRFWVNIIKNPEFLFDVHKSHIVDSCLSVVAQTFMDSCSTHEQRLGKDSPSSKLLYAKDIPRYRRLVSEFYKGVEQLPAISDLDMALIMSEHSVTYATDLNVEAALQELMVYARQYRYELLEALDDNSIARRLQLGVQFEHLSAIINEQSSYC